MHCYVGCVPLLFAVVCSCSGGASLDWVACERPTIIWGAIYAPTSNTYTHTHTHMHTACISEGDQNGRYVIV